MRRCVVSVATTPRFQRGQNRLGVAMETLRGREDAEFHYWKEIKPGWPTHEQKPYGFKAYAMRDLRDYADVMLWCDASILPVRNMDPLWERIERDGYWIARNGWVNYDWCADSAYPDLFPGCDSLEPCIEGHVTRAEYARRVNRCIPHVVATAFGVNKHHPIGKAILDEYIRLATDTQAFCGPWKNDPQAPCGPPDVLGHRHDQTALSVLAWRNGCKLTDCPDVFAYKGGESEQTILLADGSYE